MFRNYFRITVRNLRRNKGYAIINILGLAAAIAVCILIFLVIRFETSFDDFHRQKDHIYRVVSVFKTPTGIDYESGVAFPTGPALRHDFPQLPKVASIVSLGGDAQFDVRTSGAGNPNGGDKKFKVPDGVYYAEPEFFQMFDFKWLAGDKEKALKDPNSILLTKSVAETEFGDWQQAIGKTLDVSYSFASPIDNNDWNTDIYYNGIEKRGIGVFLKWADVNYPKVYGLRMLAGRFYTQSDTPRNFVVNEAVLKWLGIKKPEDAIGAKVQASNWTGTIVGVVKNFNVASLRDTIRPVLMADWKASYGTANVRLRTTDVGPVISEMTKYWKAAFPQEIFDYHFLDESIAGYYKEEAQLSQLFKIFAAIAIGISCLGLFGLVSFIVVQKNREVAIRKTLGASVTDIVFLFSKEYAVLVVIAFFIAGPVSWYFMHGWLENYAYHVPLGSSIFLLTLGASLGIAVLTVGYKSIRAALASPVKGMRTE